MNLVLLTCSQCESEFDVSEFPSGKKYRCSICEEILETPSPSESQKETSSTATSVSSKTDQEETSQHKETEVEAKPKKRKKNSLEASLELSETPQKKERKTKKEQSEQKSEEPSEEDNPKKTKKTKKTKKEEARTPKIEEKLEEEKPKKENREAKREKTSRLRKADLASIAPPVNTKKSKKEEPEGEIQTLVPVNKTATKDDGPKLQKKVEVGTARKKTERLVKSEIRREISIKESRREKPSKAKKTQPKSPSSKKWLVFAILAATIVIVATISLTLSYLSSDTGNTSTTNAESERAEFRSQFDATFQIHQNDPDKLWALAAWCKERTLPDEQKRCYVRILEINPNHEGALLALGKKPPEPVLGEFEAVFGKGQFKQVEKEYLKVASDHLSTEELEEIALSGLPILALFLKEFGAELHEKQYNPKSLPPFHLAIFSTQEAYQAYCQNSKQERPAKEAGVLYPPKRLLVSYAKIHAESGTVKVNGNPSGLLNTAIFYESYLEKVEKMKASMTIPKLNLIARQHLGESYYAILTDHYFVAMQNSDSYVSKMAIQHFVNLLELTYKWIYDHYEKEWELTEYDFLMGMYIFRNREEFLKYAKMDKDSTVLGFYEPWNHQMFGFRAQADPKMEQIVIHEGTHMIMHYFTGFRPPIQSKELFWFQEGIAEFFGSWDIDKETREYKLEALNDMRFQSLWSQAVSKSQDPKRNLMPFQKALRLSVTEAHVLEQTEKNLKDQLYKQGWGMVHFFMHYDNGKYREKFSKYVKAYIKGTSSWATFAQIFELKKLSQLDEMEEEFREYVKSLKKQK